jgi:hypothetical protein
MRHRKNPVPHILWRISTMYREKTAKEIEWDILIHKEAVQHATRA